MGLYPFCLGRLMVRLGSWAKASLFQEPMAADDKSSLASGGATGVQKHRCGFALMRSTCNATPVYCGPSSRGFALTVSGECGIL